MGVLLDQQSPTLYRIDFYKGGQKSTRFKSRSPYQIQIITDEAGGLVSSYTLYSFIKQLKVENINYKIKSIILLIKSRIALFLLEIFGFVMKVHVNALLMVKFYFRTVITKALRIFPCSKLRWFLMQFNSHIETKSLLAKSPHGSHHVFTFRKDYLGRLLTVKSSLKLATFYNRFLLYFEPSFSSFSSQLFDQ